MSWFCSVRFGFGFDMVVPGVGSFGLPLFLLDSLDLCLWFGLGCVGLGCVGLEWSGLVLFGSVWFGLVWFGLVWFLSVLRRFALVCFDLAQSGSTSLVFGLNSPPYRYRTDGVCHFSGRFDFVSCTVHTGTYMVSFLLLSPRSSLSGGRFLLPREQGFEINDQTGRPLTDKDMMERHHSRMHVLQKVVFEHYRKALPDFPFVSSVAAGKVIFSVYIRYSVSDIGCPIIDVRYSVFNKQCLIDVRYLIPGIRFSIFDTGNWYSIFDVRYLIIDI